MRTASASAFAKRHCSRRQCAILIWCPASVPPPPVLLRDDDTGEEDSKVAAAVAMDASSAACFLRWNIWPHPRLLRLFLLPLASGTAGSAAVVALSGEPLRRPGESAHCVLLEPSRRTELVRGRSGERGFEDEAVLGVVEPLEAASLHSDPELATSAAASRDRPPLANLRRSDGATRPGVSVTPEGLVDGRSRMDRPNAWPPPPLPEVGFPIFRASASASAKRGSSVQLRCRERACGVSSLARWSASVAASDDDDDKGDGGRGNLWFLPLLPPPMEEEGHNVRAMEAAPPEAGAASDREETERRALWWPGDGAAAWRGDRPGSSVPEADFHRFDDDMAARDGL